MKKHFHLDELQSLLCSYLNLNRGSVHLQKLYTLFFPLNYQDVDECIRSLQIAGILKIVDRVYINFEEEFIITCEIYNHEAALNV